MGIIGESGSGKSTLLNIIMGLINPISGKIEIDGEIKNLIQIIKKYHIYLRIYFYFCRNNICLDLIQKIMKIRKSY